MVRWRVPFTENGQVDRISSKGAKMIVDENHWVTTHEELAQLYARPAERVINKVRDHVDALGHAFISASPFVLMATGSKQGFDCSPKGDKPGFVLTTTPAPDANASVVKHPPA